MIHSLARVFEIIAVFGTVSSCIYFLLCLWSANAFLRERKAESQNLNAAQNLPPISILKPLKGVDPEIYESFRSHCLQNYPEYEIIFGVSDPGDPAVTSVERLQREFPERTIQLVVCPKKLGANIKVSNLAQMLAVARYEYLLVNDSDIRVEADYLRKIIAPLADPKTGMVTCLYRGVATNTLGSQLESLGISTDFCPGVLAARQLEGGLHFGLGSTLLFRRVDLQKIGGFESFIDYLADDYELGKRIADLGMGIELSGEVVETHLPAYNLRGFFAHQLRWARGVRGARSGGYFGLVFTFGLMWACLAVVAACGAMWAWILLAITFLLRFALAIVVGRNVLRDRDLLKFLWLLPLRDLIGVVVWIASFAGRTVTWRGDRFAVREGKLIAIDQSAGNS
jgi:ceramide glucosyltransferase